MWIRVIVVALGVALLAPGAAADPVLRLATPSEIVTEGGTKLSLPPGYFVPEPKWRDLDTELKRLQESETRLKAENESLRSDAGAIMPGWLWATAGIVAGGAAVWYVTKD